MSKRYSLRLGTDKIVVLVNPLHIIAFPSYDNTKGRCCEYLPVGKAVEDENGNIQEFDSGTYSFEYTKYSVDELNNLIKEKGIKGMQEEGDISTDIVDEDISICRDTIKTSLSNKLVYID